MHEVAVCLFAVQALLLKIMCVDAFECCDIYDVDTTGPWYVRCGLLTVRHVRILVSAMSPVHVTNSECRMWSRLLSFVGSKHSCRIVSSHVQVPDCMHELHTAKAV